MKDNKVLSLPCLVFGHNLYHRDFMARRISALLEESEKRTVRGSARARDDCKIRPRWHSQLPAVGCGSGALQMLMRIGLRAAPEIPRRAPVCGSKNAAEVRCVLQTPTSPDCRNGLVRQRRV
jgi:hypothetical protein